MLLCWVGVGLMLVATVLMMFVAWFLRKPGASFWSATAMWRAHKDLRPPGPLLVLLGYGCFLAGLVIATTGFRQQPPGISFQASVSTTIGKGRVRFFQYKGERGIQTVMICSDFRGDVTTEGPASAGVDNIYKQKGSESGRDGRRLEWQLETKDASSVKVRLGGKEYDASKGSLFLVKTKGGKTEVEQLAKDLSAVQPDTKSIEEFARKDAAVSKFLGIKAD